MSFIGCLLGLQCTSRARTILEPGSRAWWLVGGAGIWVMHFIAMPRVPVPSAPEHL